MKNPLTAGQQQVQQAPQTAQMPDMNALFAQFRQDPMKYLSGMNIPQNITDPRQIVTFLADNGKIPPMLQARVNAMLGRNMR